MTTRVLLAGILIGATLALVLGAASNQDGSYQVDITYGRDGWFAVARVNCVSGEVVLAKKGELELFPNATVCIPADESRR